MIQKGRVDQKGDDIPRVQLIQLRNLYFLCLSLRHDDVPRVSWSQSKKGKKVKSRL